MKGKIVSITKKGQATLPAELRRKHGMDRKAVVVDTEEGLLVKPLPNPNEEMGSLKEVFEKSAEELLTECRAHDTRREERLEELV